MKKCLLLAALSMSLISPTLFAQNLLKDAVRLNRDIKETKAEYKDDLRRTEHELKEAKRSAKALADGSYTKHKLSKAERKAAKKVEKIKDGLDPRDEIRDKVSRDIKREKRKAIDNWLAE
ncbi:hypothetical protein L2719_16235 [Shewanella schlegeliana]|uniref:DUF1090 domain-containing protein n=1 Tax=Shewanella schlegeliana TaxID=190308 RepID=A0ABS1SWY4_9GAMM|nr:hypothetical protein [Shewanella schlegeliana]MBL4913068.1 hypothetical protein [Shewanella schlegeliana]MCL1111082.1 hypothetical protein [Shewanella schlegeliana]GIU28388.1 hypothetical protein TUM4433_16500 [Shewanella schlegeliana]